jgi:circadian clock protein KaiB
MAPPRLLVRLYLAGTSPNSLAAINNLRAVLEAYPHQHVELEVVDVLTDSDQAARDGVFITPMLIKVEPHPERRILGRLHDRALLVGALGLFEVPDE